MHVKVQGFSIAALFSHLMTKFTHNYSVAQANIYLHIHSRHNGLLTKNILPGTAIRAEADSCSELQREAT